MASLLIGVDAFFLDSSRAVASLELEVGVSSLQGEQASSRLSPRRERCLSPLTSGLKSRSITGHLTGYQRQSAARHAAVALRIGQRLQRFAALHSDLLPPCRLLAPFPLLALSFVAIPVCRSTRSLERCLNDEKRRVGNPTRLFTYRVCRRQGATRHVARRHAVG